MQKYIFIILLTLVAFAFGYTTLTKIKNNSFVNKSRYICDATVHNCTNHLTGIPPRVCMPGGKCS